MKITFSNSESGNIAYCRRCGVIAGESSECPNHVFKKHDFTTTSVPLVCQNCGVLLGEASKCPGYYHHDFIEPK